MTKTKILEWIKSSKHVTTDYCENDSNGNNYARDIFERDGKLWSIEYVNGEVMDRVEWSEDKGNVIRTGDYNPREMKMKKVVSTRYEFVD